MVRLQLSARERAELRWAWRSSPCPALRVRSVVLLWLDAGWSVAAVARAYGVSRPLVYRVVALWLLYRRVDALSPILARRLRPWRRSRRRVAASR